MAASKAEFDAALTEARATADATVVKVKSELADTRAELDAGQGATKLENDVDIKIAFAVEELEQVRRRDDPRGGVRGTSRAGGGAVGGHERARRGA